MVEHQAFNLLVLGSNPSECTLFFYFGRKDICGKTPIKKGKNMFLDGRTEGFAGIPRELLSKDWTRKEIRQYVIAVDPTLQTSRMGYPLPNGKFGTLKYPMFGHIPVWSWINHGNLNGFLVEVYRDCKQYNPNNPYMISTWLELDENLVIDVLEATTLDLQMPSSSPWWNESHRLSTDISACAEMLKYLMEGYKLFYTYDIEM